MTILIIVLAIGLQIYLSAKKVSPFLSLLIVAILAGLSLGMKPGELLQSIEKGVGSTLGGLALIICLGAFLGKILEVTGAAEQITTTLIRAFGISNIQWAVMLTGFLIGIPLYYNAGFVILVPLVVALTRKTGLPLLYIVIPMAASLSTTHCFLPPHPGPVVLVKAFNADMGKVLLYGIVMAIPAVIVAGPLLGRILKNLTTPAQDQALTAAAAASRQPLPSVGASLLFALMPVGLIAMGVLAAQLLQKETALHSVFHFLGDPVIALLITVLLAVYWLGIRAGQTMTQMMKLLSDAIAGIAMILLIITAGGVFKQVLIDSGTGSYIAGFSSHWQMPPLLFAWVITALLRVMIGSATVAGITAAGVVAPLLTAGNVSPELMVLAVGAGSVFGSHINDSGFWMFKEFFGLTLPQTLRSWTVMETVISVIGLAGVLVLEAIL
ncbi:gluconate:H+ symporter [Paraflavitalea sp. CAU 1676]|uniref:gluconate:H+ symporter n=1 Tax=Paraflavitalea sp. CAU 1676 TaxID=3032598 RepID=UPI0023DBFD00|nr:gluconate:H+ symporter [Paraflavitalea sp. CAU 1676]MDF2193774.1 gluconate:H+ symporter [Paraflavitalea sp. CAU 1676]